MKLTVMTANDDIVTVDVTEDMELENFKALLEFESGVPANQMTLIWNMVPLTENKKSLKDYGIKDGDMVVIQPSTGAPSRAPPQMPSTGTGTGLPAIDFGGISMPGLNASSSGAGPSSGGSGRSSSSNLPDDPATVRQMLLNSPHDLALLKERNPPLAEALLSGDLEKFSDVLKKQQQDRSDRETQRIRMLNADPFDDAVQAQIAEEIRMKNVESNMETAMEYSPESFGQVIMLYIDCVVNGHPVKAFVDSGAQMTIMSKACAERCNIMRLVDRRWAGIAKGVGVQKIIGRVHLCQIKIGPDYLGTSFSILEEQPMDMLLGLDMLKRHQCTIDLKTNKLLIGTTGSVTSFLPEGELPEHARLNRTPPDEDKELAQALSNSAQDAGAAGSSGAGPSSQSAPSHNFPPADVAKLQGYGFSLEQVVAELTKAQGNVDQALASLFAQSFQVPS